jgi:hypothetical protein
MNGPEDTPVDPTDARNAAQRTRTGGIVRRYLGAIVPPAGVPRTLEQRRRTSGEEVRFATDRLVEQRQAGYFSATRPRHLRQSMEPSRKRNTFEPQLGHTTTGIRPDGNATANVRSSPTAATGTPRTHPQSQSHTQADLPRLTRTPAGRRPHVGIVGRRPSPRRAARGGVRLVVTPGRHVAHPRRGAGLR